MEFLLLPVPWQLRPCVKHSSVCDTGGTQAPFGVLFSFSGVFKQDFKAVDGVEWFPFPTKPSRSKSRAQNCSSFAPVSEIWNPRSSNQRKSHLVP